MRNSTKAFGIFCLSSGIGLFLYWTMFLISYFLRITRFGVEVPNINASTGIIGAVCVALFTFGIVSVRLKPTKNTLVLVRNAEGKVSSILQAERGMTQGKAKCTTIEVKSAMEAPQPRKLGKPKSILLIALLTAPVIGYASIALILGTYSPFMAVSSQSMQPTLNYGDLVVMRGEQAENIRLGDIIAFNVPSPFDKLASSPTVHRVVEKWTENDEIYFKTRGDYNNNADAWDVPAENVVGEYTQFKIPYMGFIFLFLKTPLGLALLALTVAFAFVYDHYKKNWKHEA